jgi:sulfatase maturation enzyme AslB (radical SAM superfamily)
MVSARDAVERGEVPNPCQQCLKEEKASGWSKRIASNQWYNDHGIDDDGKIEQIVVDVWLNNLCNLKCAICGPSCSTTWQQELGFPVRLKVNTSDNFIDYDSIRMMAFTGGEPLLSKYHTSMLDKVIHKSDTQLSYNTNGTILPSPELLQKWSEFKLVEVLFSIDDIGERFEFQRYPASWKQVVDNLHWFYENSPNNVMFKVNATVSILNEPYIKDLHSWFAENFPTNKYGDPVLISTQPVSNGSPLCKPSQHAIDYLNTLDIKRGTNWRSIFPKLDI